MKQKGMREVLYFHLVNTQLANLSCANYSKNILIIIDESSSQGMA